MKKILVGAVLICAHFSSYAWGPYEQGILTGILGATIYNKVTEQQQQQGSVIVQTPVPNSGYQVPQHPRRVVYCYDIPQYDRVGNIQYFYRKCEAVPVYTQPLQ